MKGNNETCHNEFAEMKKLLTSYEEAGIKLTLSGKTSSPNEVAFVCTVKERGAYMSDFVPDRDGRLREIRFDRVKII